MRLKFNRFGNAFVAIEHGTPDSAVGLVPVLPVGTIYVVSVFLDSWAAYHKTPEMDKPQQISRYYESHLEAERVAENFAVGLAT